MKESLIVALFVLSSCAGESINNPYLLRYDAEGECFDHNPGLQVPAQLAGPIRIRFKEKEKQLVQSGLTLFPIASCFKYEVDTNTGKVYDIHSLTRTGFKASGLSGTFTKTKKIETDCGEVQLYNLKLDPSLMAADAYTGSYDCK